MTPQLGAFGVVRTTGWKAAVIRAVTHSTVNHAILYAGLRSFRYNGVDYVNEPCIVEANPSGAAPAPLSEYPAAIWSDGPPEGRAQAVADAAWALIGTPYSWVDDACIGLTDIFGWHVPPPVRERISGRSRLMCSQLVDVAYRDAGIELFTDGRVPGDVAPGDLLRLIQSAPLHAASPRLA